MTIMRYRNQPITLLAGIYYFGAREFGSLKSLKAHIDAKLNVAEFLRQGFDIG